TSGNSTTCRKTPTNYRVCTTIRSTPTSSASSSARSRRCRSSTTCRKIALKRSRGVAASGDAGSTGLTRLPECHLEREFLAVADDGHGDLLPRLELPQSQVEIVEAADLLAAELDDAVASLEA